MDKLKNTKIHRTMEWCGLEATLKIFSFQLPCREQGPFPLGQVAQSPMKSVLESSDFLSGL